MLLGMILFSTSSSLAQQSETHRNVINSQLEKLILPSSDEYRLEFRKEANINPERLFIDHADAFGLGSEDEMRINRKRTDSMGYTHIRFQQYHKGIQVTGAEFLVHQNKEGYTYLGTGQIVRELNLSDKPLILPEEAVTLAIKEVPSEKYYWEMPHFEAQIKEAKKDKNATYLPKAELIYGRVKGNNILHKDEYRLVYTVDIYSYSPSTKLRLYIDANSGSIVKKESLAHEACTGSSVQTSYYGSKNIYVNNAYSPYKLYDDCGTTAQLIHVWDWNSSTISGNPIEITSANNQWTSTIQKFGASTLWGVREAMDYLKFDLNRQSYNANNAAVTVYVDALFSGSNGIYSSNASFDGSTGIMMVGLGSPNYQFPNLVCLSADPLEDAYNSVDVLGHELGHGVVRTEANLKYHYESGAIDESIADIFGIMTERRTLGTTDWKILTEKCTGYIRNMANPNDKNDPDTYNGTHWVNQVGCVASSTNDSCGVHQNSGVGNYWFYLLCQGGSGTNDIGSSFNVTGVGYSAAQQIVYKALVDYSTTEITYLQWRTATVAAAKQLYGNCSEIARQTANAWYAVGVGPAPVNLLNHTVCGNYTNLPNGTSWAAYNSIVVTPAGCNGGTSISAGPNQSITANEITVLPNTLFTAPSGASLTIYVTPCSN